MESLIQDAKQQIFGYGEKVAQQKLDEMMESLCEDATISMPNTLPLEGKAAIREFYETNFSKGNYHFKLEFTDEKEVAEMIFINGLMDKNFTSAEERSNTSYDFSFILKKENDVLKIFQMRLV
jgi:ketosteroid isomerase-like protein